MGYVHISFCMVQPLFLNSDLGLLHIHAFKAILLQGFRSRITL